MDRATIGLAGATMPPVAYLVARFPALSETFILNEIVRVARHGVPTIVVSMAAGTELEQIRHAEARSLAGQVVYAKDGFPWAHLLSLVKLAAAHPIRLSAMFVRNLRLPALRGVSKLGRFVLAARTADCLRRAGTRHIHAHWTYPSDVGLLVADLLGLSLSISLHGHEFIEEAPEYARQGFPLAERLGRVRFVLTCTRTNRDLVAEHLPPAERAKVLSLYHGLDLRKFARRRPPPAQDGAREPLIVSVGRLASYKRFDHILEACAALRQEGLAFRVEFAVLPGSLEAKMRRVLREQHLEQIVSIRYNVTQEKLVELYERADIAVFPSDPRGELGVANVIVEAMAMELAVLTTIRPPVQEYVRDGISGLLVEFGDIPALTDRLRRLLTEPALRRSLGQAARATVEAEFDLEANSAAVAAELERAGRRPN